MVETENPRVLLTPSWQPFRGPGSVHNYRLAEGVKTSSQPGLKWASHSGRLEIFVFQKQCKHRDCICPLAKSHDVCLETPHPLLHHAQLLSVWTQHNVCHCWPPKSKPVRNPQDILLVYNSNRWNWWKTELQPISGWNWGRYKSLRVQHKSSCLIL